MVRTLENYIYNNNISCNPRNNDIGWITGHIILIWNGLYTVLGSFGTKTDTAKRRVPTPNQACPSQEADQGAISSPASLQPYKSPHVVLRQPRRTLSLQTIFDTASKLGHNI
jgi:hypothetical protein